MGAMMEDGRKEARWRWSKAWPKSGTLQAAETCRKNFPIWVSLMRRNFRSASSQGGITKKIIKINWYCGPLFGI
jgi:hypothetical protein